MATTLHLKDFVGGWLTGNFDPCLVRQENVEVAVKCYSAGAHEASHHHRIATEYTVVATGRVRMFDREYIAGEIVQVDPNESTDFTAIEDTVTVVLKFPSEPNDKYLD
ncbi:hypothetical protein CA13_41720 [Planctomycetes bacterium CA13]|uniref:Cupin domain protein n=1 Tax=Novipirellula herctigrandis TaxID=2527986 RepID=A0A5C5Z5N5_9BACT|nr:hypothetical protein CA13_41720 [Planctomycetes bacterium CA13]